MSEIIFVNNFHNTSYAAQVGEDSSLSQAEIAVMKRALCGVGGCRCSGPLGTRGPQMYRGEPVYLESWGDAYPARLTDRWGGSLFPGECFAADPEEGL